ncbi:MAG TPA: PDZ domain-containing protein, partial [Nocardioides sp.]|nr:PDZ domain-containing protein [Nocardioides sp.]
MSRRLTVAATVAIVFLAGIIVGGQVNFVRDAVDDVLGSKSQDATTQAIDLIQDDYFHTVDPNDLENASIAAIIAHIKQRYHDHFSHYLTPSDYAAFSRGARFSGVGMAVNEVPQGLRVATVYKHSPARAAGITPGDVVTAVNGQSIAGQDADAVTARIRGPEGTKVTLTVQSRNGRSRTLTLVRREVDVPQVTGRIETAAGKKVGYVRLAGFFPGAHGELRHEVIHLYEQGAQGIVLDLRNNGGGLL